MDPAGYSAIFRAASNPETISNFGYYFRDVPSFVQSCNDDVKAVADRQLWPERIAWVMLKLCNFLENFRVNLMIYEHYGIWNLLHLD